VPKKLGAVGHQGHSQQSSNKKQEQADNAQKHIVKENFAKKAAVFNMP